MRLSSVLYLSCFLWISALIKPTLAAHLISDPGAVGEASNSPLKTVEIEPEISLKFAQMKHIEVEEFGFSINVSSPVRQTIGYQYFLTDENGEPIATTFSDGRFTFTQDLNIGASTVLPQSIIAHDIHVSFTDLTANNVGTVDVIANGIVGEWESIPESTSLLSFFVIGGLLMLVRTRKFSTARWKSQQKI